MWFTSALSYLLKPLHHLLRIFGDHYVQMGEHKAQLERARQAHRADLEYMVAFWAEEDFQAALQKLQELGAARCAKDRAVQALDRRCSQRAY